MEMVAVVLPLEFLAVTVYVAAAATAAGIPEITPSLVVSVRPLGKAGATE